MDRVALAVHFQDHRNTYQKAYKEDGQLIEIGYDKLCKATPDADPDYSNSAIFPVVYNG